MCAKVIYQLTTAILLATLLGSNTFAEDKHDTKSSDKKISETKQTEQHNTKDTHQKSATENKDASKASAKTLTEPEKKAHSEKATKKTLEESPQTVDKLKTIMEGGFKEKAASIKIKSSEKPKSIHRNTSHHVQKRHVPKHPIKEQLFDNHTISIHKHWSYEGDTGPQFWAKLAPENHVCTLGKTQSPIHIQDEQTISLNMDDIQFFYKPSTGTMINNGHTLQFNLTSENYIIVRGQRYRLLQFHFHHPAEERINHKGFALVAHFVHRNEQGQLAVVAVLFDPGSEHPVLGQLWANMPFDQKDQVSINHPIINLEQLLPTQKQYYQFMGSLTTPPCTENVLWTVLKNPIQASPQQIKIFAKLFPNNARPTQPINDRIIKNSQ